MSEEKTKVEQLEAELNEGYTGLHGLVVRGECGEIEITKLPDYRNKQPVAVLLSKTELQELSRLACFLEKSLAAKDSQNIAEWNAESILSKPKSNPNEIKVSW
jgi:hypothetical protein